MSTVHSNFGQRPLLRQGGSRAGVNTAFVVAAIGVVVLAGAWLGSTYNALVRLDQEVKGQWAQVDNAYQRRMDLIPNLVQTVKGAAAFEKETFVAVTEARAQAGQMSGATTARLVEDPAAFERFQRVPDTLSSSLSRLMAVSERYPELRATQNFRDLQAQLEGTENRIAVERMRFNEAARSFNTRRTSFPTVAVAGLFGPRFGEKAYFQARTGAETPPSVRF